MELREFRAEAFSASDEGRLEGLVAPFGHETIIGDLKRGGFREEIAPGAFRKTLGEGDVILLDNHDMTRPLARKSAGTLDLREVDKGLEFSAQPADTSYGRDLRTNIKAGNIGGMSFGFEPVKDDWFDEAGAPSNRNVGTRRVLREVKLIEVSPVTRPAYSGTVVSARSQIDAAREDRGPKPYGNVKYADPKNGKYPIDTRRHVLAAWSYINMPKNAAKYPLNGVKLSSVKAAIKGAMKKLGIKASASRSVDLFGYCPEHGFESRCKGSVRMEERLAKGTKKRMLQIQVEVQQAMQLLQQCDLSKLPQPAQDAAALISAVSEHAGHIVDKEKLTGNDVTGKKRQKPDSSTSADDVSDDALLAALMRSQAAVLFDAE